MKKKLGIAIGIVAIAAFALMGGESESDSQPAGTPAQLTIGIYTPTVQFATSQARFAYVQSLARAVEANVGTKVVGRSYTSIGQLRRQKVDFAIIAGQCWSANSKGKLLANAVVGGNTTRRWALYSSQGSKMQALRGKKLAFVKMGCKDSAFVDNAMLESEVGSSFFSGRVGKPDVNSAVAEVVSRKGAAAVFAPNGAQKGLTKVFDTGSVPNPAFVQLNTKLSAGLVTKVKSSVVRFGGGGAISGWKSGSNKPYSSLRGRMGTRVKRGLFAAPSPVRVEAKDVLIQPKTLDDTKLTEITQHFEEPAARIDRD